MKAVRTALAVVGFACALVFFSFSLHYRQTPEGEHTSWGLGLPFSPWLRHVRGPSGTEWVIDLISWSWLVGLGAVAAFWGYCRLGRRPAA